MDHRATRTVTVALTTRPWIISGKHQSISVTSQEGRAAIRVVSTADDADTAESRAREVLRELRDRIDELLDTAADGGPDVDIEDLDPPVPLSATSRQAAAAGRNRTADGLNWLIYNRRGASGEIRSVDANPHWLLIDIGRHDKVAQYAIWRATGAVYLLDEHGAVADDELYRP